MRLALVPLAAICVYAASIDVEITPARKMIVHENFSRGAAGLIFLASPCARIEKIQSADGALLRTSGSGPWITVSTAEMPLELSYEAVPIGSPRTCSLPLLMPPHPIDSVRLIITDQGSGLARVDIPHLDRDSNQWSATFPAVPSEVRLEWVAGNTSRQAPVLPVGWFAWNFWGLVSVLVLWTAAYLLWAHRSTG